MSNSAIAQGTLPQIDLSPYVKGSLVQGDRAMLTALADLWREEIGLHPSADSPDSFAELRRDGGQPTVLQQQIIEASRGLREANVGMRVQPSTLAMGILATSRIHDRYW